MGVRKILLFLSYFIFNTKYLLGLITELKDTLEYVGSALKQKLYDSMKSTWNKVSYLAMLNKADDRATVTQEVTQVNCTLLSSLFESQNNLLEARRSHHTIILASNFM